MALEGKRTEQYYAALQIVDNAQKVGGLNEDLINFCDILVDQVKNEDLSLGAFQLGIESMFNLANHDHLTGLGNRKHLEIEMGQTVARVVRTGKEAVVITFDLDGFKEVNDTHGHQAGDAVLIEVGKTLLFESRTNDTVTRPGGDEFLVILNEFDGNGDEEIKKELEKYFERILAGVKKINQESDKRFGISAGAMILTREVLESLGNTADEQVEKIMAMIDKNLYMAKNTGRGKLVIKALE